MHRLLGILLVTLLFSSAALPAQEENKAGLGLAELIDIALKNNPETEKAWWSAKRSKAVLGLAKSSRYPSLDVQASATHAREVKYPNGPDTTFTSHGAELCLSYLLLDFGERKATIQMAKEALKAAHWASDFSIQRIVYLVAASYYEYLNAEELLKTAKTSLSDAELMKEAAEDLHRAGLRCATDLNTSRAHVAQLHMDLAQRRSAAAIAYGKLLTALGLPIETSLKVETMPEGMKNSLFREGVSTLISTAEKERADLLAKQATLGEMQARVTRAKRAPLPKLKALGQGGWFEYTRHQGNGYNYSVGLSLEVPIFKGFEHTYQKRLAYADAEITLAELSDLRQAISLEVLTYSESVRGAQEALTWSDEYLDQAAKSYEGSLDNYKAGLQNIFDLLQAQAHLADARIKKAQARTQWLVSLAELAFATGTIMKE